ncbi:MAG: cupin domain-containing protein [Spirochaetaceae bacterium]
MKITKLDAVPAQRLESDDVEGVMKQLPVGSPDGAPNFSMRVFTLDPGGYTPYHAHPWEHENYILQGSGVLVNEHGEETPVQAGDFALVLPNEKHQFRNTGSAALQFICLVPKEHE